MDAAGTRVEFHTLGAGKPLIAYLPAFLAGLTRTGERLLVRAADAGQARTLDEALWQLDGFLPHCLADDPDHAVAHVVIAAPGQSEPVRACTINLRGEAATTSASPRIVEFIPEDDAGKQAARARWRAYLGKGWSPEKVD